MSRLPVSSQRSSEAPSSITTTTRLLGFRMNEPSASELLRRVVRNARRLARRLTHARQTASPDLVPHLASLEQLACELQKKLDRYLEGKTYRSVRPLCDLKATRRCFRYKLPLPGEPLQWHLPTTVYDVCPTCGRPTIEMKGRRYRFCTSCGSNQRLPCGVGQWKERKLRARKPRRLPEDDPLPCSFSGCDWDRYRGEWCDFHGKPSSQRPRADSQPASA